MAQNTSSSVMQQRIEPHDSLDDFPTPCWGTRALIEHVIIPQLGICGRREIAGQSCWEPACNRGHMVKPLNEYFRRVIASDILDYGAPYQDATNLDFLLPYSDGIFAMRDGVDWVITNPPFRLAEQFIERAKGISRVGYAMIVRTSFLEGVGRWERLFSINPPTIVAQFAERVPMVKGRLTATGSTATSYCWLVWLHGRSPQPMMWIGPCRKQLERAEDYA